MSTDAPIRRVQYPDGTYGGHAATVPDHTDPDRRATAAEMEAARAWAASAAEYDLALAVLVHARKRLDEETLAGATHPDFSKTVETLNRAEQVAPVPATREEATEGAWVRHYAALALAAYAAFRDTLNTAGSAAGPDLGYLIAIGMASTAVAVALTTPPESVARKLWNLTPEGGALNGEYEEWVAELLDDLGINPADLNPHYNAADFRSPPAAADEAERRIGVVTA